MIRFDTKIYVDSNSRMNVVIPDEYRRLLQVYEDVIVTIRRKEDDDRDERTDEGIPDVG